MKRALVIGGSGFIGLNLVDELIAQDWQVRCTRRKQSITVFLRKRPVELVRVDLDDTDSLAAAMQDCDAVFMAAGYYPRYSLDRDTAIETGTAQIKAVLRAAQIANVPRFIYTSSIATLDRAASGKLATEDTIADHIPADSVYRAVKWAMEREVQNAALEGLNTITMMPGACIGPWDVRVGTSGLLLAVVQGLLPWWVNGIVNLVDVGDVAKAHVAAANLVSPKARYCHPGHNVELGVLFRRIVQLFGGSYPARALPRKLAVQRALAEEQIAAANGSRVAFPLELVDMVNAGQAVSAKRIMHELHIPLTSIDTSLYRAHQWFVRFKYLPSIEQDIAVGGEDAFNHAR
ncbi:MAG: NAD-dependent epimerase/dehydratase family protein [Myxococcales bacterium]|nr:MAG: NAD-dependent epimerase/dehydratase family protein [Myxococcales bacterium]